MKEEAPMLNQARRIYALQEFTVEKKVKGWYYTRTSRFGRRYEEKGPYRSRASVALMIARELAREIGRRDAPYAAEE
jgi:hypothetical protein